MNVPSTRVAAAAPCPPGAMDTPCLDENTIVDFVRGKLPPQEMRSVERHLDACAECRAMVAASAQSPAPDRSEPSFSDAPTEPWNRFDLLGPGWTLARRFRLVRRLGTGGMGCVYAAHDEELDVQVALKLLHPELSSNQRYVKKLRREIVIGRRVTHPNVCRIYDLGHEGDVRFITMELVEGETLSRRLARARPSPRAAQPILLQIVDGLAAAHACGVVHRDLKPSNIMVGENDRVTVMDFGLARDSRGEATYPGALIGTPAYWAPEQEGGFTATPASDVYSFGVVALELLTGRRTRDPSLVARPWRDVIERCLARDPAKRFPSGAALRAAIDEARRHFPGPSARNRMLSVAVSLAIVSASLGQSVPGVLGPPSTPPVPGSAASHFE